MEAAPRRLAHQILVRVAQQGAYSGRALDAALDRTPLPARDRALVTELVYGTLRARDMLDQALGLYLKTPITKLPPPVQWILRLGAYQLLHTRIAAHGAVGETVNLVAKKYGHLRGVVNAVLRKVAAARPASLEDEASKPLTRLASHLPTWLSEQLISQLGEKGAQQFEIASEQRAPITLRPQMLRQSPRELVRALHAAGTRAKQLDAPFAQLVEVERPGSIEALAGFAEGHLTVQDPAAWLAGELVDPQRGEVILDLCAAPGGKATHVAEKMHDDGHVLALELHPGRTGLIDKAATRLGLKSVRAICADATDTSALRDALRQVGRVDADCVLLDAPCSGLGTLRRHPELRNTEFSKVATLAALQKTLLDAAAAVVRPGGRLIYVLCTITPMEAEAQVESFLARWPSFGRLPTPAHLKCFSSGHNLRTWTHLHAIDSFFFAALERHDKKQAAEKT